MSSVAGLMPEWEQWELPKTEGETVVGSGGPLSADDGAVAVLFLQTAFMQERTVAS